MKAYITGMAGFLGSHLRDWLVTNGHEVIGCDDLSTGAVGNLDQDGLRNLRYFNISTDAGLGLMRRDMVGVDVVYHTAAAAYEGVSVFSPAYISKNIYAGSANVFSAAIHAGVKRIVNCSSMARYGAGVPPFQEDDPTTPVDPYGLAKLGAEKLLVMLSAIHGIEYSIAVPHNIYGPRQKYDDPYRNVAAIMVNRLLQGKQPVIYGDGSQIRCFSYITDVVPCLARMGFEPQAAGQVINLGPDKGEVTINQLAQMLCEIMSVPYAPIMMPGRPQEVKHALCGSDKARELLGYEAKTPLADGLRGLILDIRTRGPKPFKYRLKVEVVNDKTPKTWTERII